MSSDDLSIICPACDVSATFRADESESLPVWRCPLCQAVCAPAIMLSAEEAAHLLSIFESAGEPAPALRDAVRRYWTDDD